MTQPPPGQSTKPGGSVPAELAALLATTPYRALWLLGHGGMGEVWAIEHIALGQRFALKVMHPHQAYHADRMRVEAETQGQLDDPHIVAVVDFWISPDGRPCIVMELLLGRTLFDELAERSQLPVSEALTVTQEILFALIAAHGLGVVHRDLKPENIFLHEAPGFGRITKVLDFGIARILPNAPDLAPQRSSLRTDTGLMIGSARYMSPEAWDGAKLEVTADIYSLGMMLYVMLTGHGPYDLADGMATPPSKYFPSEISADLDAVVLRAIRTDPTHRYQSANAFLSALAPSLSRATLTGKP